MQVQVWSNSIKLTLVVSALRKGINFTVFEGKFNGNWAKANEDI